VVTYEVVRNDAGQYSVWPAARPRPAGWHPVGVTGNREECLAQIEVRWTGAPETGDGGSYRAIHERIADGSAIAARCADLEINRVDLLATSRAWAQVLAGAGAGPEVPVAILVPRSVDALLGILAVVRAGSAYVPLSIEDNDERLLAILADCGNPLVVAADGLVARLSGYRGRVLGLDELRDRAAVGGPDRALPRVSPDNLAFIFYTSGTTGRPKGVEGTHRQLTNYALWCRDAFPHHPGEWTVWHASMSFLGSLTTIFTPLLAGWPIEIAPEGATVDDLMALLERVRVGLLKLTPTHVRMMLARGAGVRRTARMVMIASEPLVMTDEFAAWIRADPAASFVNAYGLTETHGCLFHRFGDEVPVGAGVPVGTPMPNVRVHVVDEDGAEVPAGKVGELLVGGDSIGRGYHGRPGLTADRWVPDRHGPPGARTLRTGDLAQLRPDGTVELVGRADRQVKVRGHRVEPGAVEHALRSDPAVLDALVLPRQRDGTTTLVAYVVPRAGTVPDPTALHRSLARRLPPPSVPGRIAVLPDFPMNANGKVDVSALPEPPPPVPDGGDRWTRYDRAVADAYAAALDLDAVGLHDDFFALGGDSLTAVHVALAVKDALRADVPVPVADRATVRGYAEVVAEYAGGAGVQIGSRSRFPG
jgi:amino acid adenylation domain-containing protein